jgi:hypothetical protein
MVENGPGILQEDVRAALKLAACNLSLNKWDRMHIASDACSGIIETAWNPYPVGTRSGILFRAQIDSGQGEYKVNFLLNTKDLERGAAFLREMEERGQYGWGEVPGRVPCDALYQFYDLRQTTRRMH